jgi:DNA replication protein DnaC
MTSNCDPTIATLPEPEDAEGARDLGYWAKENVQLCGDSVARRIPARYSDAVVTHPEIRDWVRTLVAEARPSNPMACPAIRNGPSLLVLGPTGTGKTYEAWGAVRALAVSGARFTFEVVTAADLYAKLRPRHGVDSEAEFVTYARPTVLVLDDLGAAKGSEWVEEVNYRLINTRYEKGLPTLCTSNVPVKQLADHLGDRVTSRLTEMAQRVVLEGGDRRRARGLQVVREPDRPAPPRAVDW